MTDLVIANEADLKKAIASIPPPKPGEECFSCHRKVPQVRSDAPTGPKTTSVVSIREPVGEEGTLNSLAIGVVDKFQEQWPRDHAAMRAGIGLELVGGRNWTFHVHHFALYAVLMVPGLEPSE